MRSTKSIPKSSRKIPNDFFDVINYKRTHTHTCGIERSKEIPDNISTTTEKQQQIAFYFASFCLIDVDLIKYMCLFYTFKTDYFDRIMANQLAKHLK